MQTAAILYRVSDFLKQYPPFNAIEESDLLDLASRGRVKFHEDDEYVLWQGKPHGPQIFVVQQGTVSLWDESAARPELRDVRGAGDLLGIDRFHGTETCAFSVKSQGDVLIYGFPAADFGALLQKYPHARQYVSAQAGVAAGYQAAEERASPRTRYLHDVAAQKNVAACEPGESIRQAAGRLLATGAPALAVVGPQNQPEGFITAASVLRWVSEGGGDSSQPAASVLRDPLVIAPLNATVVDGTLAMAEAGVEALALTSTGTAHSPLIGVATARDLAPVFGDQPLAIVSEIRRASSLGELRALHSRTRGFLLQHLAGAAEVEWLARFSTLAGTEILKRIVDLQGLADPSLCWCVCGAAGRGELLTSAAPRVVLMGAANPSALCQVLDALKECGFQFSTDEPPDASFDAATVADWKSRYLDLVNDPILHQIYLARPLFDLRPVHGDPSPFRQLEAAVQGAMNRQFLAVLANDCLGKLPPLTFFENAVVDESGEHSAIFQLEQSALRPLVDVGRVFGMAAGKVLGGSTLERLALARTLLPEREAIFREAAETLRVVLWQQGRIGISQQTDGSELPPALLSRYDRQILRGGFRSLHRLLEFTAEMEWLDSL